METPVPGSEKEKEASGASKKSRLHRLSRSFVDIINPHHSNGNNNNHNGKDRDSPTTAPLQKRPSLATIEGDGSHLVTVTPPGTPETEPKGLSKDKSAKPSWFRRKSSSLKNIRAQLQQQQDQSEGSESSVSQNDLHVFDNRPQSVVHLTPEDHALYMGNQQLSEKLKSSPLTDSVPSLYDATLISSTSLHRITTDNPEPMRPSSLPLGAGFHRVDDRRASFKRAGTPKSLHSIDIEPEAERLLKSVEFQSGTLTEENNVAQARLQKIQAELKAAQRLAALQKAEEQRSKAEIRCRQLEEEVEDLRKQCRRLEGEASAFRRTSMTSHLTLEEARSKLKKLKSGLRHEFFEEEIQGGHSSEELGSQETRQSNGSLTDSYGDLADDVTNITKLYFELKRLTDDRIRTLENELKVSNSRANQVERELEGVKAQLPRTRASSASASDIKVLPNFSMGDAVSSQMLQELQEENKNLQQEIADISMSAERKEEELLGKLFESSSKLSRLEEELLLARESMLTMESTQYQQPQHVSEDPNSTIVSHDAAGRFTSSSSSMSEKYADASRIQTLEQENLSLQGQLNEALANLSKSEKQLNAARETLSAYIYGEKEKYAEDDARLEEVIAERDRLRQKLAERKTQNNEGLIASLYSQIQVLQKDAENLAMANDSLRFELLHLRQVKTLPTPPRGQSNPNATSPPADKNNNNSNNNMNSNNNNNNNNSNYNNNNNSNSSKRSSFSPRQSSLSLHAQPIAELHDPQAQLHPDMTTKEAQNVQASSPHDTPSHKPAGSLQQPPASRVNAHNGQTSPIVPLPSYTESPPRAALPQQAVISENLSSADMPSSQDSLDGRKEQGISKTPSRESMLPRPFSQKLLLSSEGSDTLTPLSNFANSSTSKHVVTTKRSATNVQNVNSMAGYWMSRSKATQQP